VTQPALSVLIDTFNQERYIEQALVSVLEQDFPACDCEILVVDDGSTDRTPYIVRRFEPRVRLLRKKNGGQASAFNLGFRESRGRLIALLDGDDWWAKGKLSAVVDCFERNPHDAAVSHAYHIVRERESETQFCGPRTEEVLTLGTPEQAIRAREHWHFLLPCALTVRRKVFERVIPIPEVLVFSADGPIATTSMAMGVRVLPRPLAYYRVHSENLNAIDERDMAKMRSKYEMGVAMYEIVEHLLVRQGVPSECVSALLDQPWVDVNRTLLMNFGGSRLRTFHTEMRYFRYGYRTHSLLFRLLKYPFVGAATLVLPPRIFYRARDWYRRQHLGGFRERFAKAARPR
jgi:glycosyltransferase involved in cell wall biosynthesis